MAKAKLRNRKMINRLNKAPSVEFLAPCVMTYHGHISTKILTRLMQLHLYARPVVTGDFYKTSINQIAKKKRDYLTMVTTAMLQ